MGAQSTSVKKPKAYNNREERAFLFPRHLSADIGAECTDFLSIQEQCCMRRTSIQFERFVQRALRRVHTKGIVLLTRHKFEENSKEQKIRMIAGVATACPLIEEFYFMKPYSRRPGPFPIDFYLGGEDDIVTSSVDVFTLRGLAVTKHLKRINLTVFQHELAKVGVIYALKMLPNLQKLCLSIDWDGDIDSENDDLYGQFLEGISHACNTVPEVHVELRGELWSGAYVRELTRWNSMRSISFVCAPVSAPDQDLLGMAMFLPESVQRVVIRVDLQNGQTESEATYAAFFNKAIDSFTSASVSWEGHIVKKTLYFDTRRREVIEIGEDSKKRLDTNRLKLYCKQVELELINSDVSGILTRLQLLQ